jgi:tetratricopeptide (TPR) repeat protein
MDKNQKDEWNYHPKNILDTVKLDQANRLAKNKSKEGSLEEAKRIYLDILARFPNNKKANDGIKSLSGQVSDNSSKVQDPPQDRLKPVVNLYSQGQHPQALKQAKELLQQFPNSITLHNICGAVNAALGQFDAALNYFSQVIKIKPNYAEAYSNMGNALKGKGDLEAAIDNYNQAIKIKPDYYGAYYNMGNVLQEKGESEAAIVSYKQAIKIKPDHAQAYFKMGVSLQGKGDLEAAIVSYKQATKIKSDHTEAYGNMGLALKDKGDLETAIVCFDKANDKGSIARALECTYFLENYNEFNQRLDFITKKDPANLRVAAMSAFAAHQINQKDTYPFCRNPIELIQMSNIRNHVPDPYKFINTILDEMNGKKAEWEPKNKTTKGGFQTNNKLFSNPSPNMKTLEGIIKKELKLFYTNFKANKNTLIENWPDEIKIAAWYVRMLQSGHQDSHIHPAGWVSGVFYLKTVEAPTQQEGAIEFGLQGYNYPVSNEDYPRRLYQPCDGDLVLFPSSLFHKTIPVIKDVERCVIAFDLVG